MSIEVKTKSELMLMRRATASV